jgi:dolichyl-phosphate-mannose--protein O-mannosyl transferase
MPNGRRHRRLLRISVLVPLFVVTVASGIRLWGLTSPSRFYWDESYYAFDASAYVGGLASTQPNTPALAIHREGGWVHPPLGKEIIALGIGPMGFTALGIRLPSAIFGIAGVLLLYLLALELWGSEWWAGLAGLLLALDGLHVVHSRIAMLDVFLTTFLIAGFYLLVLDRKVIVGAARSTGPGWVGRWFGSTYRLGSGAMFGAALATKWSGLFGLGFALAVCVGWLVQRARQEHGPPGRRRLDVRALGTVLTSFVIVPGLIYLASSTAFFTEHGFAIGAFFKLQGQMLHSGLYHRGVQPENSPPWSWPLLLHPIRYFPAERVGRSDPKILALGNPVLWWGFLILLPALGAVTILRRRWQEVLVMGGYMAMYVPWLFLSRTQFIHYMLPAVPFMALGTVAALRSLPRRIGRGAARGLALAASVSAAAYMPWWLYLKAPAWWMKSLPALSRWR